MPEPAAPDDSAAEALAAERRARFEHALAALPVRLRVPLALREIEGLSYAEIALALNCPTGTVMSRLHQARRLLLKKLNAASPPDPS
jgi:RNA polymerase sigma-70 factor (ECF subfamily)